MGIGTKTRRNLWLILLTVIVLCATVVAVSVLVDAVDKAMDKKNEYEAAQRNLTEARIKKQELQVLIDMYNESPNKFKEYIARKNGYIYDGQIIFEINGD